MTAVVSSIADAVRSGLDAVTQPLASKGRKQERSSISLTAPTPNNIGQVRKLNSVLFPVRYSDKWYKDILKSDNVALSRLGLYNDIPVAVLSARYEQASSTHPAETGGVNIYLMTLGVLAPYRRRGLASELLRNLLDIVRPGGKTPAVSEEVVVRTPEAINVPEPATSLPEPASLEAAEESSAAAAKTNGNTTAAVKTSAAAATPKNAASPTAAAPKRYRYLVQAVYLHVQTSNTEARAFYESHGFKVSREIKEYYRTGVEPQSAWLLELRA
ncbi:hypothetical protein V8E36_001211 [Tilletia maclaganii]